jgi:hypothetical protein
MLGGAGNDHGVWNLCLLYCLGGICYADRLVVDAYKKCMRFASSSFNKKGPLAAAQVDAKMLKVNASVYGYRRKRLSPPSPPCMRGWLYSSCISLETLF